MQKPVPPSAPGIFSDRRPAKPSLCDPQRCGVLSSDDRYVVDMDYTIRAPAFQVRIIRFGRLAKAHSLRCASSPNRSPAKRLHLGAEEPGEYASMAACGHASHSPARRRANHSGKEGRVRSPPASASCACVRPGRSRLIPRTGQQAARQARICISLDLYNNNIKS